MLRIEPCVLLKSPRGIVMGAMPVCEPWFRLTALLGVGKTLHTERWCVYLFFPFQLSVAFDHGNTTGGLCWGSSLFGFLLACSTTVEFLSLDCLLSFPDNHKTNPFYTISQTFLKGMLSPSLQPQVIPDHIRSFIQAIDKHSMKMFYWLPVGT